MLFDINNSTEVRGIGAGFDPDSFAATLLEARIEELVVIAKDVNGLCYFPSEIGPHHPEPDAKNLLGRQVKACQDVGIGVYVVYPVWWDEHLAIHHPEWLMMGKDRSTSLPAYGEPPAISQMCLSHPGLLEVVKQHTSEIFAHCEPDGVWFDMVNPATTSVAACYCVRCVSALEEAGESPVDPVVQQRRQNELCNATIKELTEYARALRPDIRVLYNTMAVLGTAERLPYLDEIEIECIPTGLWGYHYLPVHGRYARGLGVPVYGLTGRFAKHWGDYGGLKHPTQLRSELASTVALGLRCDIGDDPGPALRLDPAVYGTVAEAYQEIERIEPYLRGAAPVSEAAIVVSGPPLSQFAAEMGTDDEEVSSLVDQQLNDAPEMFLENIARGASVTGLTQLLQASHIQFDIVDRADDIERYQLLVLPDTLEVDDELAGRLQRHLDDGKAVLAVHGGARLAGADQLWPRQLRDAFRGESTFERPYTRLRGAALADIGERYREFDFALYVGADLWAVPEGDDLDVYAKLTEPTSDPLHLTGYAIPPSGEPTEYATVVRSGTLGVVSFPLGLGYFRHGYWIYRELFQRLLRDLLPDPLVRSTAPGSTEITVTQQEEPERWIVHIVNHSPLRHRRGGAEYLEDPIPLRDISIDLDIDGPIETAFEARTGTVLDVRRTDDRWQVTVPEIGVAATVVLTR
ncbi:putative glycosyl hydrolase-like family 6 (GHL6) protein [Tamaricihabitans halophyticus]|uniref:Putative glycosyl hydrolase-like family 6 (GHL6) protein n=2 Tax=Tamaricihabitans halophyticus TaxID=1262583 RepID=A0A4R2R2F4_9PSEU|nr:putative glycosyl hydrolase-like family 6 (GHL6) protein [Tamaricihabitans halophyticus]